MSINSQNFGLGPPAAAGGGGIAITLENAARTVNDGGGNPYFHATAASNGPTVGNYGRSLYQMDELRYGDSSVFDATLHEFKPEPGTYLIHIKAKQAGGGNGYLICDKNGGGFKNIFDNDYASGSAAHQHLIFITVTEADDYFTVSAMGSSSNGTSHADGFSFTAEKIG